MARKAKAKSAPKSPPDKREQTVSRGITRDAFRTLMAKCRASWERIAGEGSSLGGIIKASVKNDNAHAGALGWIKTLDKLSRNKSSRGGPAAVQEWLFHFDHMLALGGYRSMAQGLPLGDGRAEAGDDDDESGEGDEAEAASSPGGGGDDEDRDLRPRHQRQPGATEGDGFTGNPHNVTPLKH